MGGVLLVAGQVRMILASCDINFTMDSEAEQQLLKEREAESLRRGLLAAADFRCIAGQPEGRRFIRRLLGECGVHQASFTGEPLTMAYREGRRSVGLWLQALFDDCPHLYIRLLQPGESASEEGEA